MIKLPPAAKAAATRYLGDFYYTNIPTVAFALKSLNGGQLPFTLIHESNRFLEGNGYQEISTYTLQSDPPIVYPQFANYYIAELYQYRGPLVYLDIESFDFGWNRIPNPSYFYLYNSKILEFINPAIKENIRNFNGKLIVRSKEHAKHLYTVLGLSTHYILPEFSIEEMLRIINGKAP